MKYNATTVVPRSTIRKTTMLVLLMKSIKMLKDITFIPSLWIIIL